MNTLLKNKPITPADFAMRMRGIKDLCPDNPEKTHFIMECEMCELLCSLGYEDGVGIFTKYK